VDGGTIRALMNGERRFSQAIADGDGISLVAAAADGAAAAQAVSAGARALVATRPLDDALAVPVLWRGDDGPWAALAANADACVLVAKAAGDDEEELARRYADVLELGLDCVVEVVDEEELERTLESLDPEVFLLSSRAAGSADPLERVLELLQDVPAGKLAIADVADVDDETLDELERAGVDAVIVRVDHLEELATRG
jgi:Indole-3-glycerol phosphate synthase